MNMNDRDTGAADGVGLNLPPPVVDSDDPLLIDADLRDGRRVGPTELHVGALLVWCA